MSFVGFPSAAAIPWNTCPLHGFHGCARCPFCTAGADPELALVHAPLLVPLSAGAGGGTGGGADHAAGNLVSSPAFGLMGFAG